MDRTNMTHHVVMIEHDGDYEEFDFYTGDLWTGDLVEACLYSLFMDANYADGDVFDMAEEMGIPVTRALTTDFETLKNNTERLRNLLGDDWDQIHDQIVDDQ